MIVQEENNWCNSDHNLLYAKIKLEKRKEEIFEENFKYTSKKWNRWRMGEKEKEIRKMCNYPNS